MTKHAAKAVSLKLISFLGKKQNTFLFYNIMIKTFSISKAGDIKSKTEVLFFLPL